MMELIYSALAALAMGPLAAEQPLERAQVAAGPVAAGPVLERPAAANAFFGRSWIVNSGDNLCGLREASQLSNPALVDYDALLKATPEMKKLEREGIDPASPKGVQLKAKATDRVAEAAEDVRKAQGHCSVWKAVRHKDGRSVQDVTSLVMAQL